MTLPDYSAYDLERFIDDRDFRTRVLAPDFPAFRAAVLASWPEKAQALDDAAFVIRHLNMPYDRLPEASRQRIWANLVSPPPAAAPWRRPGRGTTILLVAVALAVLGLLAWRYWRAASAPSPTPAAIAMVTTAYGETRTLALPDGTTVTLNANSELRYAVDGPAPREVWLHGEAYFHVAKRTDDNGRSVKFTVHSPDLDVEVLGTQFNVNTRRGKTRVVLLEGRVRLVPTHTPATTKPRPIVMAPGQEATAAPDLPAPVLTLADTARTSAWAHRKFQYNNTPLGDVAAEIEDTYGLTVSFAQPALRDRRLTADLSNHDLAALLEVIEASFDLRVEKTAAGITIRRSHN